MSLLCIAFIEYLVHAKNGFYKIYGLLPVTDIRLLILTHSTFVNGTYCNISSQFNIYHLFFYDNIYDNIFMQ